MAVIPKSVLEDIRHHNDIAEVIGTYFHVQRAGASFKALCPFHKEKTPSFHINPQRQIFHCFGCGAGGDVFKFVMQYEGVDFATAARLLAERAGIRLQFGEEDNRGGPNKDVLYAIHEELSQYYQELLLNARESQPARDYLQKRHLGTDIIRDFRIGYAPDRWDTVLQWGAKRKYTPDLLFAAGLTVKTDKPRPGSEYYDRFRHRVMFPIRNEQGRIVAFSGRTLVQDPRAAKYVNSPETPLFRKSHVLYALDRARHPITETREAIVCEGQIDVIRCHQAGFNTAVAAQGTAFTDDHARILRRYADGVVLCFDSDEAGRRAAVRATGVFLQAGLAVRVASLPRDEDPDSLILKQGAEAFRKAIAAAVPAIDFQLNELLATEDPRNEAAVMRIARGVLGTIAQSPNAVQRDALVQQVARRIGIAADALHSELTRLLPRAGGPTRAAEAPGAAAAAAPAAPAPPPELALAELLAATPAMAAVVRPYLMPALLTHPLCRAFVEAALEADAKDQDLLKTVAERDGDSRELTTFVASLAAQAPKVCGKEYTATDAAHDLVLALWKAELLRRRNDLARAQPSEADAPAQAQQRVQLTHDLKMLQRWDTGESVIRMYLPDA
jgi:DNA primase